MTTLTPTKRLFLARLLPELIIHFNHGPALNPYFFWKNESDADGNPKLIIDREWHYVVSLVEQTLNQRQIIEYMEELSNNLAEEFLDLSDASMITHAYMTLPLEQRTTALQTVLVEKGS